MSTESGRTGGALLAPPLGGPWLGPDVAGPLLEAERELASCCGSVFQRGRIAKTTEGLQNIADLLDDFRVEVRIRNVSQALLAPSLAWA